MKLNFRLIIAIVFFIIALLPTTFLIFCFIAGNEETKLFASGWLLPFLFLPIAGIILIVSYFLRKMFFDNQKRQQ